MASVEIFVDRIVQHLEQVVREETALLNRNAVADLHKFNTRKSQGLYDLSRALRRLDGQSLDPGTRDRLRSLRAALDANEAALARHLQAMREIATIISEAIREIESDGTYAPPPSRGRGNA